MAETTIMPSLKVIQFLVKEKLNMKLWAKKGGLKLIT